MLYRVDHPVHPAGELDQTGLEQLIEFQIHNGITGILVTGTTGESPTFKWQEHNHVIDLSAKQIRADAGSLPAPAATTRMKP